MHTYIYRSDSVTTQSQNYNVEKKKYIFWIGSQLAISGWRGVHWDTVSQDCCIPPLQEDPEPAPHVLLRLIFLLPSGPGEGRHQLPDLPLCCRVPAPQ